jgi:hypothetical protein
MQTLFDLGAAKHPSTPRRCGTRVDRAGGSEVRQEPRVVAIDGKKNETGFG